ncbi:MAG: hypothetical protein AB7G93_18965 [Bdellovibrionales bacterium]
MDSTTLTVMEHQHISEMQDDLRRRMQDMQRQDMDRTDSVGRSVLNLVVAENYDRAKEELQNYVAFKTSYPAFQERVERYVSHCVDLIQAIRTKRGFPGLASLSLSKQQEIHEKVLQHFNELKQNLKHIEKIERDHRLTDVRSTVWVLRTATYVVGAIVVAEFLLDLHSGLLSSAAHTGSFYLDELSTWVVSLLPL